MFIVVNPKKVVYIHHTSIPNIKIIQHKRLLSKKYSLSKQKEIHTTSKIFLYKLVMPAIKYLV